LFQPSRAAKEADERVEVSSGNDGDDVEDEEEEWEDQEGSDDEAPRRNTRSLCRPVSNYVSIYTFDMQCIHVVLA
jgi:hypothetical protein